jgi:hypothetical protein
MKQLLVEEPGKQEPEQIGGDERNGALRGQILSVQVVDASDACVGSHQTVCQLGDG